MKINVYVVPSCTWELEGDSFFCTHDEVTTEELCSNDIDMHGNVTEYCEDAYVCADPDCNIVLDGSPAEDRADYLAAIAEDEAMEMDCE